MVEFHFYAALSRAARCEPVGPDPYAQHSEALQRYEQRLRAWTASCAQNFADRAALIRAEIARLEGRALDAMDLYESAIGAARANGFVHHEAIANELAARFHAGRGFVTIANAYLHEAKSCYLRWGADGKVRQLEARHPFLRELESPRAAAATITAHFEQLDFAAVVKASQALSSEVVQEKLIDVLMRLAIEHAGAERGLLLLLRGNDLRQEAEVTTSGDGIIVHRQNEAAAMLADSVVHYVVRSREIVLLDDASVDPTYASDPYVLERHARSILCLPLVNEAKVIGVLYLENSLAPYAFTPGRVTGLKVLAAQAAISLENARLYRDLQAREAKVRRLVDSNIIGIFIWNNDGRILEANDAFLRIIGYERDELVSGSVRWPDFTVPAWQDRAAQAVERMREGKVAPTQEWEYVRKDGQRVQVLAGGAAFDESGEEGVAFILDLTDFKRAEQAVRDGEQRYHVLAMRLAEANRIASIGELSASIAHEINQPLAGIVTNANTCLRALARDPLNVELAGEATRRALRDANRASGVITRLRALFARNATETQALDLNDLAREVLELARPDIRRQRVVLRLELADAPCVVNGDRVQLEQVILNLLRNAIDAMREIDDRPRQLTIGTERNGSDEALLSVKDSGAGFGARDAGRLFEAFFTTKKTGMGIGLSVSRSIIESHRGRLWAAPNEGPGATFSFALPLAADPRDSSSSA